MTAINLVEYAKGLTNPLERGVVELYAQSSDILAAMPWKTVSGPYQYSREATLPGIAFRGINETYTPDFSIENPQVEQLFIAGGEADVDNFLLALDAGRRAREEARKIKQMARALTSKVLTGNNETDPREFDGLQTRIGSGQTISNSATSGGGALSLAKLDEAIDATQEPTHLIMNRSLRLKFQAAMRDQTLSGNLALTKDDFGRPVMTYAGLPILVGYEAGPDAKILPFTEAGTGGGTTASSIYVVSFKEGMVCGLQLGGMKVTDLGELESKPAHRTRIEWHTGMCIENPYAATRLRDIANAAIVA